MKKITSLLMLFLVCMGTAWGQAIVGFTQASTEKTLPSALTTGYYLIKEVNPNANGKPGGFLRAASESANAVVTPKGKNQEADKNSALELWYIEVNGDQFTIATANKKAAWQAPEIKQKNLVAYASKAQLTKTTEEVSLGGHKATAAEGSCIIQNTDKSACVHYTGNDLGSWTDANPASVMMFEFYNVPEANLTKVNLASVTYTYTLDGAKNTQTITVDQTIGSNYNAPAVDFVTFTQPTGTVKEGANNVTVTCTEALPFEKTNDLQNPKWLSIDMHSNKDRYMWHYDGDNTNIKVAVPEDLVSISKDEAYFWCLVGNAFDGFKIYNKSAGTSKTLNKTSDKPQITEGEATVWQIVKPQSSIANAACFKAEGTNFLNHQGDMTLGYWGNPDEGSSCRFFKPAAIAMEQSEVYAHIPENAVGGFDGVENIDPALTAAENDPYNFDKANALVEAIKALKNNGITFEEGAYYRIISAFPNFEEKQQVKKCMLAVNGNEYIRWGSLAMNDVNNVFQLEKKSNNKFCLKNANRGKYMQGAAGLLGDKENAADMEFVDLGAAKYNIHYTNGNCHTNGHNSGNEPSGDLVAWDGGQNSASAWYLVKADNVEVPLTNVGEASYATAYLPFAVSNVADATAFVGKKAAEGNALNMTSVASIPANTGVVLKGAKDAGKAVLTIGEATTTVAENALSGTLVEKDYANELVLGNNDGNIGFYGMNTGAKIGANKAFLPATASGAQGFVLNFDGEATAIESVMGETNTDAPVYDLSGRRVVKTVKGGLYIQNGKKFIVR